MNFLDSISLMRMRRARALVAAVCALGLAIAGGGAQAGKAAPKPTYAYSSVGDPAFVPQLASRTTPSYVLMGGGPDVDEAFRWMIKQAGITSTSGGRLVVIRASGDGAYDPYIYYSNAASSRAAADIVDGWVGGASLGLTSVETLVVPDIAAANDPFVNRVLAGASAVWIAGGDQADYIKFWKGQALERTLAT